jgi:hypothetical protein
VVAPVIGSLMTVTRNTTSISSYRACRRERGPARTRGSYPATGLGAAGYTVLVAAYGKEALELLDRQDGPIHLLAGTTKVKTVGSTGNVGWAVFCAPDCKLAYGTRRRAALTHRTRTST